MSAFVVFASGVLFAMGLSLSGMTQPEKVRAFLDFTGRWDPSLAFVMLGAVVVYFVAHRFTRLRARPIYGERFPAPLPSGIDGRLLAGAALFGVGWGLSGFCPGPALVAFGAGMRAALWFAPAMLAGMALYRLTRKSTTASSTDTDSDRPDCA
jgi:uncharacterized membrane protein YedE/YeeE